MRRDNFPHQSQGLKDNVWYKEDREKPCVAWGWELESFLHTGNLYISSLTSSVIIPLRSPVCELTLYSNDRGMLEGLQVSRQPADTPIGMCHPQSTITRGIKCKSIFLTTRLSKARSTCTGDPSRVVDASPCSMSFSERPGSAEVTGELFPTSFLLNMSMFSKQGRPGRCQNSWWVRFILVISPRQRRKAGAGEAKLSLYFRSVKESSSCPQWHRAPEPDWAILPTMVVEMLQLCGSSRYYLKIVKWLRTLNTYSVVAAKSDQWLILERICEAEIFGFFPPRCRWSNFNVVWWGSLEENNGMRCGELCHGLRYAQQTIAPSTNQNELFQPFLNSSVRGQSLFLRKTQSTCIVHFSNHSMFHSLWGSISKPELISIVNPIFHSNITFVPGFVLTVKELGKSYQHWS